MAYANYIKVLTSTTVASYKQPDLPKRGRPFSQMGEFDLSLIREFRHRPAFYDRNSPQFKDKVFTAHEWQVISNKLGYDVSLLKDRMLQLRNRYNLEKRRLEQIREENPGRNIESPWPLYNQLHFLSQHIRSRRSYKRMMPLQSTETDDSETAGTTVPPMGFLGDGKSDSNSGPSVQFYAPGPFPNGMLAVKMEEEDADEPERIGGNGRHADGDDNDTSIESGSQSDSGGLEVDCVNDNHKGRLYESSKNSTSLTTANLREHSLSLDNLPDSAVEPSITIRRLDTMRGIEAAAAIALSGLPLTSIQKQQHIQMPLNSSYTPSDAASTPPPSKQLRLDKREAKYEAFGQFMSAALLELPMDKALDLVQQFTSQLVQVMMKRGSDDKGETRDGTPNIANDNILET